MYILKENFSRLANTLQRVVQCRYWYRMLRVVRNAWSSLDTGTERYALSTVDTGTERTGRDLARK